MSRRVRLKLSLLKSSGVCYYCRKLIQCYDDAMLDHFIPLSKGGSDSRDNLVLCCFRCNANKGDAIWDHFPRPPEEARPRLTELELYDVEW